MGGVVSHVRELTSGVQADVAIGESGSHGYATIRITTQDKAVLKALDALKGALRQVASDTIAAAQANEVKRGRKPLGLPVDPDVDPDVITDEQRARVLGTSSTPTHKEGITA